MWYLILLFVIASGLGSVIGYAVETSLSMTTEVLIGIVVTAFAWIVARTIVVPCFMAIDKAVRNAEESAGR